MKLFGFGSVSNVGSLKMKAGENDFYHYMRSSLNGYGILKVVPERSMFADLIYFEKNMVGVFRFMDTNAEIFSILKDEIIEIMHEESKRWNQFAKKHDVKIKYTYMMPYLNLEDFGESKLKSNIVDAVIFEKLINKEIDISEFLTENDADKLDALRYFISKEYYIVKKKTDRRNSRTDIKDYYFEKDDTEYRAMFMESSEIKNINSIKYGLSLITGSSGSGKTTILFSRAVKVAKMFPKDNFMLITFNKQPLYDFYKLLELKAEKVDNLKIINFHKFVMNLASPYNIKINVGGKSFENDFKRVFNQVEAIYKKKKLARGIFLDEAENFSDAEIAFLLNLVPKRKSFFQVSQDKAKEIKNSEKSLWNYVDALDFDDIRELRTNYRQSVNINLFMNYFTDNLRTVSEKSFNTELTDYIRHSFSKRRTAGLVSVINCKDIEDVADKVADKALAFHDEGCSYSDICVLYPFHKKRNRNGIVFYQSIMKSALEKKNVPFILSGNNMSNLTNKIGVTLSNIFNINNLEFKILLFCGIESLNSGFNEKGEPENIHEFLSSADIVYTALNRAIDDIYIFVRDDFSTSVKEIILNSAEKYDVK